LIVVPLHIHSLAGACEPAWMFLPTLPFQPSIEDPDSVGTVDCQLPLYISPCSQVLYLQHLWDPLVCVANKRLTAKLSPLDATFTRNRGWGYSSEDFRLGRDCRRRICFGTGFSVQRRDRVAFLPPPMQIVHRDVQINVPAR